MVPGRRTKRPDKDTQECIEAVSYHGPGRRRLLRVLLKAEGFRSFFEFLARFALPWKIFEGRRATEGIEKKVDYLGRRVGEFHDSVFPDVV